MSTGNPRTTFMTGASSFLGHYVLRDLLTRQRRVVAALRHPLAKSARRLAYLLEQIGFDAAPCIASGQLTLVEGALPDHLPEPTWGHTDDVLHNAASLELFSNGNGDGDPFRTNVKGTRALIEWANAHRVRTIHAVSTAYTCGWNDGLIPEAFHSPAPRFQTDYEKSKWLAESLFRDWSSQPERVLTVFRPSFLVGDSETGYTTQFAGFYQFARLVSVLKNRYQDPNNGKLTHIPLRIPGRPEDVQNIVPVDFVARIIAEVVFDANRHGRIYHLTNPQPPTNELMKRCYEDYFGLHGGYFADPATVLGHCTSAESLLWDEYHLLTPRVVHAPHFDTANTRCVMDEVGLTFPILDRERICMLIDWAARQQWGRRSPARRRERETAS